jgi:RNA polymerase sigma factor (sigma-70 family)
METEGSSEGLSGLATGQFPPTQWSVVVAAAGTQSGEGREALERLCKAYWYPLYAYVRRRGYKAHDAQDFTQSYFEKLLEKHYLGQADPDRGKFRTFLLTSLKNFLANEWDRANRLKRGGQYQFVSWDHEVAEDRYRRDSATNLSPDALYDRSWIYALLESVMDQLKCEYEAAGKGRLHEELKVYLTGASQAPSYAEAGERLGLSQSAMKMAVLRLRKRYGQLLRNEIAQTVATPEEIDEEMRHPLGLLA